MAVMSTCINDMKCAWKVNFQYLLNTSIVDLNECDIYMNRTKYFAVGI